MVDDNANIYLIGTIFSTSRFLGSLDTNLSSKLKNSKRRIQYSGLKLQKDTSSGWNLVIVVFWRCWLQIRAQHLEIQNVRCNIANQNAKSKKLCREGLFVV